MLGLTSDPLFQKMEGDWQGEGIRTHITSGREVRIESVVHSRVLEDGRLFSLNDITETEVARPEIQRKYRTAYWVRARTDNPETYDLGVGERVTGRGYFGDIRFVVEQEMQSSPDLVVRTISDFVGETVETLEVLFVKKKEQARTVLRYRRVSTLASLSSP